MIDRCSKRLRCCLLDWLLKHCVNVHYLRDYQSQKSMLNCSQWDFALAFMLTLVMFWKQSMSWISTYKCSCICCVFSFTVNTNQDLQQVSSTCKITHFCVQLLSWYSWILTFALLSFMQNKRETKQTNEIMICFLNSHSRKPKWKKKKKT